MAFVACLVESAVQMMDRRTAAGAVCRGFFPGLQQLFGAGAFDPGGARFHHFLRGDTGTDDWSSADALEESWTALRGRYAVGQTMTGPLDDSADVAGRGAGTHHLQRLITAQVETVQRDRLHREFVQLPVADTRRVAWLAVDRLSSQWVPSWPTDSCELSDLETPEVITTYLGRESPKRARLSVTWRAATSRAAGRRERGSRRAYATRMATGLGWRHYRGLIIPSAMMHAAVSYFRYARRQVSALSSSRATSSTR